MLCSAKDSIPKHQKTNVTYKAICPDCNKITLEKLLPI